VLLAELVDASERVRSTRARSVKITTLADLLRSASPAEAPVAVAYLSGRPLQDRLGVGYASVHAVDAPSASEPMLTLDDVDATLDTIAETSGPGSKAAKADLLASMFGRATAREQDFLRGLILRNLRQGALEGVMADAVAVAIGADADDVRRAAMLAGDLTTVATDALVNGASVLDAYRLSVFTPVQPMLAKTADSVEAAVETLGRAAVEWKLDGLRIQVHRSGDRVAVFTRNLNDLTDRVPEIVTKALELPVESVILDGEALLVSSDGTPLAFQDSMSRFGSEEGGGDVLTPFYFDILHLDGVDLIERPTVERRERLESVIPADQQIAAIATDDPAAAARFYDEAVGAFHEGVVIKDATAPYEAGRRGGAWLKVKPAHTLDLVILAAEWGSGRRKGWLSNLHLGARDPAGGFVMLGKTFKGLTDEMLTWQTERFLEVEHHREGHVVFLEPRIVYEIAFDGVQRSPRYPGGMALRFARVKRYREDKDPEDADTVDTVRAILERRG
jgi:ATP-dependent DNA ligase I